MTRPEPPPPPSSLIEPSPRDWSGIALIVLTIPTLFLFGVLVGLVLL